MQMKIVDSRPWHKDGETVGTIYTVFLEDENGSEFVEVNVEGDNNSLADQLGVNNEVDTSGDVPTFTKINDDSAERLERRLETPPEAYAALTRLYLEWMGEIEIGGGNNSSLKLAEDIELTTTEIRNISEGVEYRLSKMQANLSEEEFEQKKKELLNERIEKVLEDRKKTNLEENRTLLAETVVQNAEDVHRRVLTRANMKKIVNETDPEKQKKISGRAYVDSPPLRNSGDEMYGTDYDEYVADAMACLDERFWDVDEFATYLLASFLKSKKKVFPMSADMLRRAAQNMMAKMRNHQIKSSKCTSMEQAFNSDKTDTNADALCFESTLFNEAENVENIVFQKEEFANYEPLVAAVRDAIENPVRKQIFDALMEGHRKIDIADTLEISAAAVSKHVKEIGKIINRVAANF